MATRKAPSFKFNKLPGEFPSVGAFILAKRQAENAWREANKATSQERAKEARAEVLAAAIVDLGIADTVDAIMLEMVDAKVPMVTSDEVSLMAQSVLPEADKALLSAAVSHYLSRTYRGKVGRGGGYDPQK